MGTLVALIEGIICAVVILPMFGIIGAMGGLAMGLVCRLTNWPRQAVYSLAALPIALGLAGNPFPESHLVTSMQRSVYVQAAPDKVWQAINNASDIRAQDFAHTLAARISVPMPEHGVTTLQGSERVRDVRWGKGVNFSAVVTHWQPAQHLRVEYRFTPESFPKGALDDHVLIGGHYFDLRSTDYHLRPEGSGTRLTLSTEYRVSTQFNFYAEPVAKLFLGDMLDALTAFYKRRSEQTGGLALVN
jgi:hypothetical protein